MAIAIEHLHNLYRIGFPIVGLYDDSRTATYAYVKGDPPIFSNPDFWNAEKIDSYYYSGKFINVAAVFGKSHIKDNQGQNLYLNGLDVDCEEANRRLSMPISELLSSYPNLPSKMVTDFAFVRGGIDDLSKSLLDVCKKVTYVTKSHKSYGHPIHWLSHHCYENITPNQCKQYGKFELFTGASAKLCHLPDSMHREHRDFRYQAVGRTDVIIRSDDLYTMLTEIFKDLLLNEKIPQPEPDAASEIPSEMDKLVHPNDSSSFAESPNDFQDLSPKAIQLSIGYLSPYYVNGDRQNFTLPFAGLTFREKISLKSAREILTGLCKLTSDDEIDNRLRALHDTYEKGRGNKLLVGGHTLAQLIAKMKGYDLQSAEGIVKMLKTIWTKDLVHQDRDYEDKLIDEYHFKTIADTDEIWFYNHEKGIFVPNGESLLKTRIEADHGRADPNDPLAKRLTNHDFKEHVTHIQRRTQLERDAFNPDIAWVACNNCMVNVVTGEMQSFDPRFMSTTKIPVNYDHTCPAGVYADFFRMVEDPDLIQMPRVMEFFFEIMDCEDVHLFLDYLAYSLWRDYRHNNWMLLVGKGFNGKSILLDLIERFFGKENKCGETLDRLLNGRFSIANLFNKMVNVDADVSADVIFKNTGILKKLTGSDLHAAEHKFKRPFYFRNYAKLYFSCNEVPETEDTTDAFLRRLIQINFTHQFFGEEADHHLIDKLCTEEQFSILLSDLLARLPRIIKHGIRDVTNEALSESYDKYMMSMDPVRSFYEKALVPESGSKIPKPEMLEHYNKYCRYHGLTPESDQSFSRKLTKDYHVKSKQVRVKGESYPVYVWLDFRLVDWQEVQEQAQMNLEEIVNLSDQQKQAFK